MKPIVKVSKRKTLAIQILDGRVIVRAPFGLPNDVIEDFLKSKQDWIVKKLAQYQPLGYHNGMTFKLFGKEFAVSERTGRSFNIARDHAQSNLIIYRKPTHTDTYVAHHVDMHFKLVLDEYIRKMLAKYCALLNIAIPPYTIRKYKRLYGRCSRSGALAFNVYLYHEDLEFIEYVVVHELAHLYQFNHSPAFYKVVATMMPHYKDVLARRKAI